MREGNKFIVSASPYITQKENTVRRLMLDVIIALMPCFVVSVVFFGLYAFLITVISVATCVLTEYLFNLIMKKPQSIKDLSAVITGLILSFNLPPSVPLYLPVVGGVFAIIIIKMLFGGLGKNFANPAASARIFLVLSFTVFMTSWIAPISYEGGDFWQQFTRGFGSNGFDGISSAATDGVSSATPLSGGNYSLLQMFLGNTSGSLGETSALAILIGFVYLCARRVIHPRIPFVFVFTTLCFTYIFTGKIDSVMPALLGGGLLFGAVFMATDYSTSPNSNNGQIVFALGLGFLTVLLRQFTGMPEGVSYAILIMNLLVPIIDKSIYNKQFGSPRKDVTKIVLIVVFALILIGVMVAGILEGAGVTR